MPQQALALAAVYPDAAVELRADQLDWVGVLQPTPLSRAYTVKVTCRTGRPPKTWVVRPALETRLNEPLPHIWSDGSLCLNEDHDWSDAMMVADTIVPWASEWLIYYEIWLQSGIWFGGGVWPPTRS